MLPVFVVPNLNIFEYNYRSLLLIYKLVLVHAFCFKVLKKLSATALSPQFPFLPPGGPVMLLITSGFLSSKLLNSLHAY